MLMIMFAFDLALTGTAAVLCVVSRVCMCAWVQVSITAELEVSARVQES